MKKIIFVTLTLGNAGAERVSSLLINSWIKDGYQIEVVQTQSNDTSMNYHMENGIKYHFINSQFRSMPLKRIDQSIKVARILRNNPEAIGMAFVRRSILTLGIASFISGNRIIVSERNDPRSVPKGRIAKCIRNIIFMHADACVFQTEEAKQYFPMRAQEHGYIIPNPVNPDLPKIAKENKQKRIIAVCRLSPQKNLKLLISAYSKIAKEYPEYRLDIFGDGPEKENLEETIKKLGMENYIKLRGFSKDIYKEMNDSEIYVSSSNYEGISNSMLEALAMGLPSIVTDCPAGGARMVIKNGVNGFLIPVGDEEALIQAIQTLIDNPKLRFTLSDEAAKIRKEYSIDSISKEWIEVIQKVSSNGG